nr:pseudouridine synthase [uncultured Flavobacterium sp.]
MAKIILFNKPYGVLSQFTGDIYTETLSAYISTPNFYAAGRLDKDSEGLLILTNDGKIQHELSNPKFKCEKIYWAQVENIPTEEEIAIFVKENFEVKAVLSADDLHTKFQKAKEYVDNGKALDAWKLLLAQK